MTITEKINACLARTKQWTNAHALAERIGSRPNTVLRLLTRMVEAGQAERRTGLSEDGVTSRAIEFRLVRR